MWIRTSHAIWDVHLSFRTHRGSFLGYLPFRLIPFRHTSMEPQPLRHLSSPARRSAVVDTQAYEWRLPIGLGNLGMRCAVCPGITQFPPYLSGVISEMYPLRGDLFLRHLLIARSDHVACIPAPLGPILVANRPVLGVNGDRAGFAVPRFRIAAYPDRRENGRCAKQTVEAGNGLRRGRHLKRRQTIDGLYGILDAQQA